ncbi:hypothetical protein [Burkholderia multivorans]|uniref:hypothetical protein n=1 Tax=Burkholderia multivorans TaxID=87883 RepID=UPI001B8FA504|nr:hypothetical protein [Burkholderia multivorans]MBR8121779.1 hypothetical protein [Burkholderia multivorans]MBU9599394.1 hypothetical protein [Burkholderia multivorans]
MQVQDFSRGLTCGASRNDARALLLGIGNMSLRKLKKAVRAARNCRAKRDQVIEWNKEIPFRRDSRTRPVSA